jgi:hypothetical protein
MGTHHNIGLDSNCLSVFNYVILRIYCVYFSAIDAPGGFLFEWWSVFWDIFIARTNEKHSEVAATYIDVSCNALWITPRQHSFLSWSIIWDIVFEILFQGH